MANKKSIALMILAICLIIPAMALFSACGKKPHEHTYSEEWSINSAEHYHAATCEHGDQRKDAALHTYGEWVEKTPAGYGVERVEKRTCSVCGHEETRTVAGSSLAAKARTISLDAIDASALTMEYSGEEFEFVEILTNDATISGARDGDISVEFKQKGSDEDFSQVVPKNAGTYAFRVKVSATAEWQAAQSGVGYLTITPKTLTAPKSFAITKDYDGTSNIYTFSSEEGVCAGDEVHLVTKTSTIEPINYTFTAENVELDNSNYVVSIADDQIINLEVKDTRDFYMAIEDVFSISGKGVVVTGYIARGTIKKGDKIEISGIPGELTALELTMSTIGVESATYKQNVGILLGTEISRDNIKRGQIVSKPGTMQMHSKFVATIKVFTKAEGGRNTPFFTNYKPQAKFYSYEVKSGEETKTAYAAEITSTVLIDESIEMVRPGETATVTIVLESATPLWEGLTFTLYEGGKTVATGTITMIVE